MTPEEYNEYNERFTTAVDAAKEYLRSTDYIIIRAFELGEPIPEDVKAKRAKARVELSENTQKKEDLWALEHIDLFPVWVADIAVAAGDRYQYGGFLWRCQQAHHTQAGWEPDVTPALWTKVNPDEGKGTKDNPIDYSLNMELEEGKYYTEDGVLYLCIRALAQSVWHLADLVGNYVEVVTD